MAVFAVELYNKHVEGDTDRRVRFDVKLEDPDGDLRQFDVCVERSGVTPSVTEVQHRGRRIGKPTVGQFVDKRNEVGASALSMYSTAGYTKSALRRVERENAVHAPGEPKFRCLHAISSCCWRHSTMKAIGFKPHDCPGFPTIWIG